MPICKFLTRKRVRVTRSLLDGGRGERVTLMVAKPVKITRIGALNVLWCYQFCPLQGQPLHVFDADGIHGRKVVVQTLPAGTNSLRSTMPKESSAGTTSRYATLKEECVTAGFWRGYSVKSTTRNVFIESACFDPVYIRKTSRRHGLNTDASFRFERGTDINGTLYALKRAALLIMEVAGGIVSSEIQDVYPHPVAGYPVEVSWFNIKRLIGKELGKDTIKSILCHRNWHSAGIPCHWWSRHGSMFAANAWLGNVRFYGYNKIEIRSRQRFISYARQPDPEKVRNIISEQLIRVSMKYGQFPDKIVVLWRYAGV